MSAYVFGWENFTTIADAFDRDVDLQWHKGSSFRRSEERPATKTSGGKHHHDCDSTSPRAIEPHRIHARRIHVWTYTPRSAGRERPRAARRRASPRPRRRLGRPADL